MSHKFIISEYEEQIEDKKTKEVQTIKCEYGTLFVGEFDSQDDEVFEALMNYDAETIEARINSEGGSIWAYCRLRNILLNHFECVITNLESIAMGVAALAFTIGHKRVVNEMSALVFKYPEEYSNTTNSYRTNIRRKFVNNLIEKQLIKLVEKKFITKDELELIKNGEEIWLGMEEMIQRGIATHIFEEGELLEIKPAKKKPTKTTKSKK